VCGSKTAGDPGGIEEEQHIDHEARSTGLTIARGIAQTVHVCAEHKKLKKLTKWLMKLKGKSAKLPQVLVFCNRIKSVVTLTFNLRKALAKPCGSQDGKDLVEMLHGSLNLNGPGAWPSLRMGLSQCSWQRMWQPEALTSLV